MMIDMGTTTVKDAEGKDTTLYLYGYTEDERPGPPVKSGPGPVWLVPDLSPCAGLLVEGIVDGLAGGRA